MSRQREYQLRKKALGLCQTCGAKANGLSRCAIHLEANNAKRRKKEDCSSSLSKRVPEEPCDSK